MVSRPRRVPRRLRRIDHLKSVRTVCVIGLGRFGEALALELMGLGVEVLGVDRDGDVVQRLMPALTKVVRADTTRPEVLEQLGISGFDRVVVSIGSDLEASILTTSLLVHLQIRELWAKAMTAAHGQILQQLGVPHVIYPEVDMGRRVAHLVAGTMQDFVDYGAGLSMAKVDPPDELLSTEVEPTRLQHLYGVRVLLIRKPGAGWVYPDTQTQIEPGDVLIIAGSPKDTESFAKLPSGHSVPQAAPSSGGKD